jgi:cyclopropane fatty-acyl-phospholipid synthase-like methyltransferase
LHRSEDEEFLAKEAAEKLFHLRAGTNLLDFGCGTAELTVYYARAFARVVAADASANMLEHARRRATAFGCSNIEFYLADDESVWTILGGQKFEMITSAGVLQYLSEQRIELLTARAREHLVSGGRVVHFDIPDPRIYLLVRAGLFGDAPWRLRQLASSIFALAKFLGLKGLDLLRGAPRDVIGYQHHPQRLCALASRCGFRAEIVWSMYYEYRYHLIMHPT